MAAMAVEASQDELRISDSSLVAHVHGLQDPAHEDDSDDDEETPPDGAEYAATLSDNSVVFFNSTRQEITA